MSALIAFQKDEGKNMGRKGTILPAAKIDGRKYLEDKPKSCDYCYWWQGQKKGCILPECYYLMPEEVKKPEDHNAGNCKTCPYGKHTPCIGYCIAKLQKEMREKKGGGCVDTNAASGS